MTIQELLTKKGFDITAISNLDLNTVGSYTTIYTATDNGLFQQNTGSITKYLKVQDSKGPVLEIVGDNPYYLEKGSAYQEPGINATDFGNPNVSLEVTSDVDTSLDNDTEGTFLITYKATDIEGISTEIQREVIVRDTQGPTLSLNESQFVTSSGNGLVNIGDSEENYFRVRVFTDFVDPNISIEDASTYEILPKVIYKDSVDTENIVESIDTSQLHTYVIVYSVKDNSNLRNTSTITRWLGVSMMLNLFIYMNNYDANLVLNFGESYSDPRYAYAIDNYDSQVKEDNGEDPRLAIYNISTKYDENGNLVYTYYAIDSSGNIGEATEQLDFNNFLNRNTIIPWCYFKIFV